MSMSTPEQALAKMQRRAELYDKTDELRGCPDLLNEWQRDFVASTWRRFQGGHDLTPKQADIIDAIHAELSGPR